MHKQKLHSQMYRSEYKWKTQKKIIEDETIFEEELKKTNTNGVNYNNARLCTFAKWLVNFDGAEGGVVGWLVFWCAIFSIFAFQWCSLITIAIARKKFHSALLYLQYALLLSHSKQVHAVIIVPISKPITTANVLKLFLCAYKHFVF